MHDMTSIHTYACAHKTI